MRRVVVGVMGPGAQQRSGDEFERLLQAAVDLGEAVARQGWALLTGGRAEGVMDAASRGADRAGGLVVGVLPGGDESDVSPHVHIAIKTDMGSARNNINVLSSDVVIACGLGPGTA